MSARHEPPPFPLARNSSRLKQLPLKSRWSIILAGEEEKVFHRSPLRRQGWGKQQAPAMWVGFASELQAGRARESRESFSTAARLRALLPFPWAAAKFLPFLPTCSKTQLPPGSPIALILGRAVCSLPCRHLPAPNLRPIWGKTALWVWRGCSSGEGKHVCKTRSFSIHPFVVQTPLFLPAWGGALGARKGIPAAGGAGAPRPPCPSLLPRAMGSGGRPDLPAAGPRRLCCSNYSSRTRRRGPPTELRSILCSSPIDAID